MTEMVSLTPLWIKEIGALVRKSDVPGFTDSQMCDLLRESFHGRVDVAGDTETYINRFAEEIAGVSDSQTKKKIMLQYAVFGMNLPVVDNEKYAKGLKSIYAGDPDGFDILKAFKKGSNEGTRYMDMYRIRNLVNDEIDRAIALLQNYKEAEQPYTSYYPGEALLNYMKSLNHQIEYSYANRNENGEVLPLPESRAGR